MMNVTAQMNGVKFMNMSQILKRIPKNHIASIRINGVNLLLRSDNEWSLISSSHFRDTPTTDELTHWSKQRAVFFDDEHVYINEHAFEQLNGYIAISDFQSVEKKLSVLGAKIVNQSIRDEMYEYMTKDSYAFRLQDQFYMPPWSLQMKIDVIEMEANGFFDYMKNQLDQAILLTQKDEMND